MWFWPPGRDFRDVIRGILVHNKPGNPGLVNLNHAHNKLQYGTKRSGYMRLMLNKCFCCLLVLLFVAGALILSQEHQPPPFISTYKQSRLCLALEALFLTSAFLGLKLLKLSFFGECLVKTRTVKVAFFAPGLIPGLPLIFGLVVLRLFWTQRHRLEQDGLGFTDRCYPVQSSIIKA